MKLTARDGLSGLGLSCVLLILCFPPEVYPVVRILSFGMAGAAFILAMSFPRGDGGGVTRTRVSWLLAATTCVLGASSVGTESLGRTLPALAFWIFLLLLFGAGARIGWNPGLWVVLLFAATFHGLYPVYQELWGFRFALQALADIPVRDPAVAQIRFASGRAFSTFVLPSHLGLFHGMVLPFLWLLARCDRKSYRLWARALMPLSILAVVLTRSYASVVAIAAGTAGALILFAPPGKRLFRIGAVALLLVSALAVLGLFRYWRGDPLFAAGQYASSGAMRIGNQSRAVEMLLRRPALGFGFGTFGLVYPSLMRPGDNPTQYAHNGYLQFGAEAGAGALAGILLVAAGTLVTAARLARAGAPASAEAPPNGRAGGANSLDPFREGRPPLARAAFVALCVFWAHGLFDFGFYLPSLAGLAFFVAGVLESEASGRLEARRFSFRARLAGAGLAAAIAGLGGFVTVQAARSRIDQEAAFAAGKADESAPGPRRAGFHEAGRLRTAAGERERRAWDALRHWPLDGRGWVDLARYEVEAGRPGSEDVALLALREAVKVEPMLASAHGDLGRMLARRGRGFGAYHEAWSALRLHPMAPEYAEFEKKLYEVIVESQDRRAGPETKKP